MNRQLGPGNGAHRSRDGSSACHVSLHVLHIVTGFEIKSAGVIHNPLTNKHNRIPVKCFFRLPFQNAENRRINASPVHSQKPSHL